MTSAPAPSRWSFAGLLLAGVWLGGACRRAPAPPREPPDSAAPAASGDTAAAAPAVFSGRPRILVEVTHSRGAFGPEDVQRLARDVPEVEIVAVPPESVTAHIETVDAFIGWPWRKVFPRGGRLRWVQVHAGGVDEVLYPEMVESRVVLTNARIVKGPEIADHAMALLLALTRQLTRSIGRDPAEANRPGRYHPIELRDRTALIIGLGGIGMQIAERASAFGMRVIASEPKDVPMVRAVNRVVKPDAFREVLPEADVVFIAAPLTAETRGLFGPEEFARLKPGAYLINVSRGKLVDTEALVAALRQGRLSGAGLDVTEPEPLPPDYPLWRFDNVVITPHIAGRSDQGDARRRELIVDNVRRFARGLPLHNVVDKRRGY